MGFSDCSETKRWMLGLADKCSTWKLIALCKGRPSDSIKKPLPTFLQVQNKFSNPLASIQWPEHRYQRDACLTVKICILPVCWKAIRFEQDLRCPGVMVSGRVTADTSCHISIFTTDECVSAPQLPEDVLFSVKDLWEQPNHAQGTASLVRSMYASVNWFLLN